MSINELAIVFEPPLQVSDFQPLTPPKNIWWSQSFFVSLHSKKLSNYDSVRKVRPVRIRKFQKSYRRIM